MPAKTDLIPAYPVRHLDPDVGLVLVSADGVDEQEVGVEGLLREELLDERHHEALVELGVDLATVDDLWVAKLSRLATTSFH